MPSAKVAALTRNDIVKAAQSLAWSKHMTKWSVLVEGKEFPVRPLVLHAAGVARTTRQIRIRPWQF